jgi:hypothetical protein
MKFRLFGLGLKGKSQVVTAQHRINCYVEKIVDEDTEQTSILASPGMDAFSDQGDTPGRGWIVVDDLLYRVHRGTLYEINNAGTPTARGTLSTTTGRVDMATDGDVILIVDGTKGYTYTIATTTLIPIATPNFPNGATTCAWQDGNFIVEDGMNFQISPDGTNWDPLDVATAESSPDGIVRVFDDHGQIILFGSKTTEFWANTGGGDFPYEPVRGATREIGLAARWSLAKTDDSVTFLGKGPQGQVQVMRLDGYTPRPVSSPELDSIINRYATVSDATGYACMFEGHPFYRLNFPTVGKSWEEDSLSGVWCERQSGMNGGRHRGEMAIDYLNKIRISDYENGKVFTLNAETYTENGTAYPMELTSRRVLGDYDPITINRLFIDFETGVGLTSGQGSDPQAMLRVSRDGGRTWGEEMWKTMGEIGQYKTRVEWDQFGSSESFVFKVRVTDPIKRVMVNGGLVD